MKSVNNGLNRLLEVVERIFFQLEIIGAEEMVENRNGIFKVGAAEVEQKFPSHLIYLWRWYISTIEHCIGGRGEP
jgi:hypothetical protein